MRQIKSPYRSLADYQYKRIIQNKRNLAQVQSVLTLYERNNKNLTDKVRDLIQQNKMLRKQSRDVTLNNMNYASFGGKRLMSREEQCLQGDCISRMTAKKQSWVLNKNKLHHSRNAYLTPQQVQSLNIRQACKQARTAQKTCNHSEEYQKFKQKLSDKKQILHQSQKSKYNLCLSHNMTMSRNVYLHGPSQVSRLNGKQPLQQRRANNFKQGTQSSPNKIDGVETSPYNRFMKDLVYHSPRKYINQDQGKGGFTQRQRSASAIKVQDVYPQNIIRIQEPRAKWNDSSHSCYGKPIPLKKQPQFEQNTYDLYQTSDPVKKQQKQRPSRKKYLKIISLSHQKAKQQQKQ